MYLKCKISFLTLEQRLDTGKLLNLLLHTSRTDHAKRLITLSWKSQWHSWGFVSAMCLWNFLRNDVKRCILRDLLLDWLLLRVSFFYTLRNEPVAVWTFQRWYVYIVFILCKNKLITCPNYTKKIKFIKITESKTFIFIILSLIFFSLPFTLYLSLYFIQDLCFYILLVVHFSIRKVIYSDTFVQ